MPKTKSKNAAAGGGDHQSIMRAPHPPLAATPQTKISRVTALLRRPQGAGIAELMAETGWQAHSVRGALSGNLKKQLKLDVRSEKTDAGRVYRIVEEAVA